MTGPRDAAFVIDGSGLSWQRQGGLWLCLTETLPARSWDALERPMDVFVWRGVEHPINEERP